MRCVACTILLLMCLDTLPVQAQESDAYRAAIDEAVREHGAGRYSESRAAFLRAHELQPSARTLRGLGVSEFELRHYADAIRLLTAARRDPRAPLTDDIAAESLALIQRARGFVGTYTVTTVPSGATISVNGRPTREHPLLLDAGEHVLAVHADGYGDRERRIVVQGGEHAELHFELVPHSAAPVDSMTTRATDTQPPAIREPSVWSRRSTWGWVSLGAAALAGVGTGIAWASAESAASRWNDDARCLRDGKTRAENCNRDKDAAESGRLWTGIGIGAVVVFGATATVLLWPSGEGERERAFGCSVGPGDLGAACTARF
jgi:hypothetical protein